MIVSQKIKDTISSISRPLISNEILLKIGFSVSIIILLSVSFVSFNTNKALVENAKMVDHTNIVIQKLNNILILVKDANLIYQDFLLSNEEKNLTTYFASHEMIKSELNAVKLLTEDNSTQQRNASLAYGLVDEVFKKWDSIIDLKKSNTFIYNRDPETIEQNKLIAMITAMKFEENNLLNIRAIRFDNSSIEAPNFLIFLTLTSLCFTVIFYIIVNANIKKVRNTANEKQEAYEEVQAINEELVATSDELKESFEKIKSFKSELEKTKDRLLEAQVIANMGNWEWDIVNDEIYWSDQLMVIFDYKPAAGEKFDYGTYLSLLHPDDRALITDSVERVLKDHKPYLIEHRIFTQEGETKWLLSKGKVVLSSSNQPVKLIGTAIDITDLKYAQTEEERLVALIDNSSDFISLGDDEGNLIFINNGGRKLAGLDPVQKDLHINMLEFFNKEEADFVTSHVLPMVMDKGKWSGELSIQNFTSGEIIPVCWSSFLVSDRANKVIGIGHIVQDMRAEKKIRQELQIKNEELYATVEQLKEAESELTLLNSELEKRVVERGKELVISEERFRLVSIATNDAIWDWNLQTDKLWWNEGFKSMFGYKDEQIEPGIESLHNRIHPEDRPKILKEIQKFLSSGKSQWANEYRFLNSEGIYIHVLERGYALHNEEGKPYRMLGTLINITERKELEQERTKLHDRAEAQRSKLYSLLMYIPAAITIMKGRDLVYEMVNEQYKTLFGVSENLVGKSRKTLSPFSDSDEMLKILIEVYNTGIPYVANEYKSDVNRSGMIDIAYFNILVEPIYDHDNKIDGLMTFAIEVTDQVISRKTIEENANRLRLMLEALPQMAWKSNPKGEVTYYNSKWYEYTGSNFAVLQSHWDQFIHPDDRERTLHAWAEAIRTESTYDIEYRWLRGSDKSYRWMLGRAMPVRNSKNEIMFWVGSCTDIHDQKLLYADLDKKNQELTKVNELLDTFVYTAAHDLKSPVINLKSLMELVKTTDEQDSKDQYFNTIDIAVNRLDDTISGLVEVIEVQSEDNKIARELNFDNIYSSTIEDFKPQLEEINASLTVSFEAKPDIVYLRSYLVSIFTNLIGNAIKYRSPDRALTIQISTQTENEYTILTVQDNGIGIDLIKNSNKIFKAFNRFTRIAQGKGLGLYLIKTMVERNGGKLEVESELNIGTVFKIYFKEYSQV